MITKMQEVYSEPIGVHLELKVFNDPSDRDPISYASLIDESLGQDICLSLPELNALIGLLGEAKTALEKCSGV